jgi:hypothetical protein
MRMGGQSRFSGYFTPGKEIQYPLYRRLGVPSSRSGQVRKHRPHRDLIPEPFSSYTDYAIPAHLNAVNITHFPKLNSWVLIYKYDM